MQLRALGPVEVTDDEHEARSIAPQARIVLAALLVKANETVSSDSLADAAWPDQPPASAAKIVQQRISQIRRALGDDAPMLETQGNGYRLSVGPETFDVIRFEQLLEQARAATLEHQPDLAVESFDQALGCWRGPAYGELGTEPFVLAEAQRLEELRLVATEERTDVSLLLGRHNELIPDLKNLVDAHPLRERFTAQLILALYRAGRQAAALRAYEALRVNLADELGLDPSTELRALETAILNQDDELELVAAEPVSFVLPPTPVSSFIGRAPLLDQVADDLARHRLVTLTGVGGAGKTRVAIEIAQRRTEPACFVDLASVTDPDHVWRAVADAFRLREQPGEATEATVLTALGSRDLLVVLDNCEHLLEASSSTVEALLARCRGLHMLSTSREPLAIPGEMVREVLPLGLPSAPGDDPDESEAVRLFVERATEAVPGFVMNDETRSAVVDLCRHLDGIPLALELAASNVVVMEPAQITAHLARGGDLPVDGGRRPARQQTLAATIAWSYGLLSPPQRDLFDHLSTFPGSFDLDTVEEVCGARVEGPDPTVLLLARLVRQSMVVREQPLDGVARYRLLDTLRDHGAANLDRRGETRAAREALCQRVLRLAESYTAAGYADGPAEEAAAVSIGRDYHHCRAALDWALIHERVLAARMVAPLSLYWLRLDMFREGLGYVEPLLEHRHELPEEVLAMTLLSAAALLGEEGDSPRAHELARDARDRFDELGDSHGSARAQLVLGWALGNTGSYDEAMANIESALEYFTARGHGLQLSALRTIGFTEMYRGAYERAEAALRQALQISTEQRRPYDKAKSLWMLGAVARDRGRLDEAFDHCERALTMFTDLGDRSATAHARSTLGDITKLQGDLELAKELYRIAYRDLEDIGDRRCTASSLKNMADIVRESDPAEATRQYLGALDRRHEIGDRAGVAQCFEGLAGTALLQNDGARAATLFAQAAALRSATGALGAEPDREQTVLDVEQLETTLGEARFASAWSTGERMPLDDAVAFAHGAVS